MKIGGVFVSSTMCMNDYFALLRWIAPLGRVLGVLPRLSFFDRDELERVIGEAGFAIEHAWLPAPKRGLFLIARKPS